MTVTYIKAAPGLGCKIDFTPAGGSITHTAQIQSAEAPQVEVGMWKSTGITSTWGEYLPTIIEGGEVSFTLIFASSDSTQQAVITAALGKKDCDFVTTIPADVGPGASGTATQLISHKGYFSKFGHTGLASEEYVTMPVTIKVTGPVTYSAGS